MDIKFAKQIIDNPQGLQIYENFRLEIICTHETPNTHVTTKLHRWKNEEFIPLEIDNLNGMEDASEVERNGKYLMACEIKDIGGEQKNIGIFKSTNGINYHQTEIFAPISGWQKDSVSRPTFYDNHNNNIVPMLYEGRYKENWDNFKTGIAYVNFETGKTQGRDTEPILNKRLVPDDIWFENGWYWYSFHSRNDALGWYAKLYKSKIFGDDLIFDSNITYKGETIIAYYRDKSFYWKNFEGMWQVQTNGGTMLNLKLTQKSGNMILAEWIHPQGVHNVHFERKDKSGNPQLIGTKDYLAKEKWEFENVWNAKEFRIRPDTTNDWGDWILLNGTEPIEPPTNDNKALIDSIKKDLTSIEIKLDKIK